MRSTPLLLIALLSTLGLAGCPTDGGGDPIDSRITYIESEDGDNDEFDDPEEVDVVWTDELLIQGSARECDYDDSDPQSWSYVGDVDNYLINNPERGYLEAILSWESDRIDLDLLEITIEETNTGILIGTGEVSVGDDVGPDTESILWEDDFRTDEELFLQVACASGSDGDYELLILWED